MTSLSPRLLKTLLIASIAGLITACGGGGSSTTAGISGTGITSGPITAFGSIFVNGVRFDIDDATITVDDTSGLTQSDLRKGMQVVVRGDFSGTNGTAVSVEFDELLQGPVDNLGTEVDGTNTFTAFGIQITMNRTSTIFENVTFDDIADGMIVEVSGLVDGSGNIVASYIKKKSDSYVLNSTEVEIKGTAENVTGLGRAGDSFEINGITINIQPGAEFEGLVGARVRDDDYVEVEGILTNDSPLTIGANEIEAEDETYGEEGDDVNIKGIVSGFTSLSSTFLVGAQTVDASTAELEPTTLVISNGLEVEVEGYISGGVLIADEVESEDGDIEIAAPIFQVNASSIVLELGSGTIQVTIDGNTQMEDETSTPVSNLGIGDLTAGNFVKLNAYQNGSSIIATELKREDIIDGENDEYLQGPVDSATLDTEIVILGITFTIDSGPGGTSYENASEVSISNTDFFTAATAGTIVKVEDEDEIGAGTPDGVADEAELE